MKPMTIQFGLSKSISGHSEIEIDRPVSDVFEFVTTNFFKNYPRWAEEVIEFKPINNNPMAVGSLARQIRIDQGQKVESVFEITELVNNQKLTIKGLSSPYVQVYEFLEIRPNTTLLTIVFEILDVELFMLPFEKLVRRAIEEGIRASIENIKSLMSDQNNSATC